MMKRARRPSLLRNTAGKCGPVPKMVGPALPFFQPNRVKKTQAQLSAHEQVEQYVAGECSQLSQKIQQYKGQG